MIGLLLRAVTAGVLVLAGPGVAALLAAGCAGGLGLVAADYSTGRQEQVAIRGHRWERTVVQEVARYDASHELVWRAETTLRYAANDHEPLWPVAADDRCSTVGCRRPGSRTESYTLRFARPGGSEGTCTLAESQWASLPEGSTARVRIGGLVGLVYCEEVELVSTPPTTPSKPPRKGRRRGRA